MRKLAYSIPEAIETSGIQRDLIYSEINSGRLKSIKIGRRRLVRAEALEQWLKEHEARASQAMGHADSAV